MNFAQSAWRQLPRSRPGNVHAFPRRTLSTSVPPSSSRPSRLQKYARRTGYLVLGGGAVYVLDRTYNASAITRNLRTLWTCALITADYKMNFTPEKSDQIPQLHERVAERIFHLLTSNGGLYIKIGQAIGANAALLPKPMQVKFASLFDDAPQIPYADVVSVFKSEFGGRRPEDVFDEFEEKAVASASIAQVHRARVKGTGEWVAVKVQKPDVKRQMWWDLTAYRAVMWMFEHWVFDLPVYFVVDFVTDHLTRELDFQEEGLNATLTAKFIESEPRLAGRVHIPKVYPELTTRRVMTAEWIDGVRLSDRAGVRRLMGERTPDSPPPASTDLAPGYAGPPLRGGVKAVMQTMVELFSAQMFSWGFCHCDPHPGNVIIRPHPTQPRRPQLVLLDHGLYVTMSDDFKREYATLWRGLLSADFNTVKGVSEMWGIGAPDLFASATLLRPVKLGKGGETMNGNGVVGENGEKLSDYEASVLMKAKLKSFLTDTDKMPKALIFLGRNMRMVQGNNQSLGSPVNRIKITGFWASRSLTTAPNLTLTERLREYWYYAVFRSLMFSTDVAFWSTRVKQWVRGRLGLSSVGFEDELEKSMRGLRRAI